MSGKVYLVGAGPGATDLLTLRAASLLEQADVVLYDALVAPQTLALAAHATKIAVGKRSGRYSTAQKFINKRLVDAARQHAVVVRLKGGDPMLFGRAQEEIDALTAAEIEFEVVPGVTAACAASAELGVSLTRRGVARTRKRLGDKRDRRGHCDHLHGRRALRNHLRNAGRTGPGRWHARRRGGKRDAACEADCSRKAVRIAANRTGNRLGTRSDHPWRGTAPGT